jgi:hypothetical protein
MLYSGAKGTMTPNNVSLPDSGHSRTQVGVDDGRRDFPDRSRQGVTGSSNPRRSHRQVVCREAVIRDLLYDHGSCLDLGQL